MRGGGANTPGYRLEALLDIHYKTIFDWRYINPCSIFVQHLQASCVILRQKSEQSSRILMRPHALRVVRCLRIFDKLESIHITFELLECSGG